MNNHCTEGLHSTLFEHKRLKPGRYSHSATRVLHNHSRSRAALLHGGPFHSQHSYRYQHHQQICLATLHNPPLSILAFSRNSKTASSIAAKSQRRFACGFASSLGSLCPSHTVFGWRPSSTTFWGGTLFSHRLVLLSSTTQPSHSTTRRKATQPFPRRCHRHRKVVGTPHYHRSLQYNRDPARRPF